MHAFELFSDISAENTLWYLTISTESPNYGRVGWEWEFFIRSQEYKKYIKATLKYPFLEKSFHYIIHA